MKKIITVLLISITIIQFSFSQTQIGSVTGQNFQLTIEPFSFSNFNKVKNRTWGALSWYGIGNDWFGIGKDVKEIKYTHLELDNNSTEKIKKVILSTWEYWSTIGIVGKLGKKELVITNENRLVIEDHYFREKSTYTNQAGQSEGFVFNVGYFDDAKTFSMSKLETASLIVTNENDTLILFPKTIRVFDEYTPEGKDITLLYYKNLETLKKIAKSNLELKKDVITLRKHFSILGEVGLSLSESEKDELNTNVQTRIIESLERESLRLPKYYFVSINRTEEAAQTKSYFYIVEKHSNNRFYSFGKEHDEFPLMDAVLNSQIPIDSVQLYINKDEMRNIVRSTDYISYLFKDTEYSRVLGSPNLSSSDTLFVTISGGGYSNLKNPLYLEKFPSYKEFVQSYLLNMGKEDLSNFCNTLGYSVKENLIYSKDLISFAVNFGKGSVPYCFMDKGTVYGSNKKEMYDYAEKYNKFHKNWTKTVKEEREKKELAAEREEEREKQQQDQELVKKYGRKYVEAFYKLKIIVGMPVDLVDGIVNKFYTVGSSSSSARGDSYRLDPRYGTGRVYVTIKNKKVASVSYH